MKRIQSPTGILLDFPDEVTDDEIFQFIEADTKLSGRSVVIRSDGSSVFSDWWDNLTDSAVRGHHQGLSALNTVGAALGMDPEETATSVAEYQALLQRNKHLPSVKAYFEAGDDPEKTALAFAADPINIMTTVAAESIASFGPYMLAAGATAFAGAATGVGLVPGLIASKAIVGSGSLLLESGGKILEVLQESGVDITDPKALHNAFIDPVIMNKARAKGLDKGMPIAYFDMVSMGMAGIFLSRAGKGVGKKAAAIAGEFLMGSTFSGTGEALGQISAGEELDYAAVLAEILGDVVLQPIEVAAGVYAEKKKADKIAQVLDAENIIKANDPRRQHRLPITTDEDEGDGGGPPRADEEVPRVSVGESKALVQGLEIDPTLDVEPEIVDQPQIGMSIADARIENDAIHVPTDSSDHAEARAEFKDDEIEAEKDTAQLRKTVRPSELAEQGVDLEDPFYIPPNLRRATTETPAEATQAEQARERAEEPLQKGDSRRAKSLPKTLVQQWEALQETEGLDLSEKIFRIKDKLASGNRTNRLGRLLKADNGLLTFEEVDQAGAQLREEIIDPKTGKSTGTRQKLIAVSEGDSATTVTPMMRDQNRGHFIDAKRSNVKKTASKPKTPPTGKPKDGPSSARVDPAKLINASTGQPFQEEIREKRRIVAGLDKKVRDAYATGSIDEVRPKGETQEQADKKIMAAEENLDTLQEELGVLQTAAHEAAAAAVPAVDPNDTEQLGPRLGSTPQEEDVFYAATPEIVPPKVDPAETFEPVEPARTDLSDATVDYLKSRGKVPSDVQVAPQVDAARDQYIEFRKEITQKRMSGMIDVQEMAQLEQRISAAFDILKELFRQSNLPMQQLPNFIKWGSEGLRRPASIKYSVRRPMRWEIESFFKRHLLLNPEVKNAFDAVRGGGHKLLNPLTNEPTGWVIENAPGEKTILRKINVLKDDVIKEFEEGDEGVKQALDYAGNAYYSDLMLGPSKVTLEFYGEAEGQTLPTPEREAPTQFIYDRSGEQFIEETGYFVEKANGAYVLRSYRPAIGSSTTITQENGQNVVQYDSVHEPYEVARHENWQDMYFDIMQRVRDDKIVRKSAALSVHEAPQPLTSKGQTEQGSLARMIERLIRQYAPGANIVLKDKLIYTDQAGAKIADVTQEAIERSGGTVATEEFAGYQLANLIAVSLDTEKFDPFNTALHETWHYLRRWDFFTPEELSVLDKNIDEIARIAAAELGEHISPEHFIQSPLHVEEAQALAFAAYAERHMEIFKDGKLLPREKNLIARAFRKMMRFLEQMGNWMRGAGWISANDIFDDVLSGAVTNRKPNFKAHLSEHQARLVASELGMSPESFGQFMASTKAVNARGGPLTLYHGTPRAGFQTFDMGLANDFSDVGPAIYLSEDPEIASEFAEMPDLQSVRNSRKANLEEIKSVTTYLRGKLSSSERVTYSRKLEQLKDQDDAYAAMINSAGAIYPSWVSTKNPLDARDPWQNVFKVKVGELIDKAWYLDAATKQASKTGLIASTSPEEYLAGDSAGGRLIGQAARELGYDSVVYGYDGSSTWAVFNPEQIRSVFDQTPEQGPLLNRDVRLAIRESRKEMKDLSQKGLYDRLNPNVMSKMNRWINTPRHIAHKFLDFSKLYIESGAMRHSRLNVVATFTEIMKPVGNASDTDLKAIYPALELARHKQMILEPNHNGEIIVHNDMEYSELDLSNPGDVIRLTPEQSELYTTIQTATSYLLTEIKNGWLAGHGDIVSESAYGAEYEVKIKEGMSVADVVDQVEELNSIIEMATSVNDIARQYIQLSNLHEDRAAPNLEEFFKRAKVAPDHTETRSMLGRVRELIDVRNRVDNVKDKLETFEKLDTMDYIPMSRFGEWGITVHETDKNGKPDFGTRLRFETFEKSLTLRGRRLNTAKLQARVAELKAKYPGAHVSTFELSNDDRLRQLNVHDLVYQMDNIMGAMSSDNHKHYMQLRPQLDQVMQRKGFRSHFVQTDFIPGYSTDFIRALSSYAVGAASYSSHLRHDRQMKEFATEVKGKAMRKYAEEYVEYVQSPHEEYGWLRAIGFTWYLGANFSSAALQLMTLPQFAATQSTQFETLGKVGKSYTVAMKDITKIFGRSNLQFWRREGVTDESMMFDITHPGVIHDLAQDEIDMMVKGFHAGELKPMQGLEQIGLSTDAPLPGALGKGRAFWRDVQLKGLGLMFNTAEVMGRSTAFLANYRMARDNPAVLERAKEVMHESQLMQETLNRLGGKLDPYTFAIMQVQEAFGDFGKLNRAPFMRGIKSSIFQFTQYPLLMLELMARTATMQGKQGKKAFALMGLGLFMAGGLQGLPAAEDLKDILEAAWKSATKEDLDIDRHFREMVYDLSGSEVLPEILSRGPLRAFGFDVSRRASLGNIPAMDVLKTLLGIDGGSGDALGVPMSLSVGQYNAWRSRLDSGASPTEALTEFMPTFMRNIAHSAVLWPQQGVTSRRGQVVVPRQELGAADYMLKAVGFNPSKVARAREASFAQRRFAGAIADVGSFWRSSIIRAGTKAALANQSGDKVAHRYYLKEYNAIVKDFSEWNAGQTMEDRVKITNRQVMDGVKLNLHPELRNVKRAPKRRRRGTRDIRKLYNLRPD